MCMGLIVGWASIWCVDSSVLCRGVRALSDNVDVGALQMELGRPWILDCSVSYYPSRGIGAGELSGCRRGIAVTKRNGTSALELHVGYSELLRSIIRQGS